jgi:hypothetical protein
MIEAIEPLPLSLGATHSLPPQKKKLKKNEEA